MFLIAIVFTTITWGQIAVTVSGSINTTPNLAASYTSLSNAITALNAITAMSGPVTLTLTSGSETVPPTGLTIGSSTLNPVLSSTNTITIVKESGTVTLNAGIGTATPSSTTPDGILKLFGADYITIDGLTFTDGNTTNPATMEFGIGLFKRVAGDGCNYNTIKNCIFNMQRINNASATAPMIDGSVGILIINSIPTTATTSLTPTNGGTLATNGTNSNNKIYSNIINGGNYGIGAIGYAASTGTGASPVATTFLGDINNDIGGTSLSTGNNILNYGGGGSSYASAGIRVNNQWSINISYNTINNNNGSGTNHATTLRGIYAQAGVSANATISYNNVTLKGGGTTSSIYAIDNGIGSTPSSNIVNIKNNTITGSYTTATTGSFYAINNTSTAATVNVNNNSISGISTPGTGTIYCTYNSGATSATTLNQNDNNINTITKTGIGSIYSFYVTGAPTVNVLNNVVDGLSCTATSSTSSISGYSNASNSVIENISNNIFRNISSTGTATIKGIYIGTAAGNKTLRNNQFYNFTVTGGGTLYGIQMSYGSVDTISYNKIYAFTNTGGTSGSIYGINVAAGTTNSINNNKIYDLSIGSATPTLYAMYISNGTTNNIYNNIIGDIRTPAANAAIPLVGIYISSGTTNNVYYNTVYLNASSTGALFGSSAIYTSTTPIANFINNIFVNTSTPNGATGYTSAYRRSSTTLTSYAATSNNNLFYAGNSGSNNVIMFDGTNPYSTIDNFKTLVGSTRDAFSISENPTWKSTNGNDADFLHLDTHVQTGTESGGIVINGYTTDYDGDIRFGGAGYAGSGSVPDIGADEFEGIPAYTCTSSDPGNTVSTLNGLCLGQSIQLSFSNSVIGTGVTYRWQSSTDGSNFFDITNATSSTYTVSPTAETYYQCIVTCLNGPVTGASAPVQITFANRIDATVEGNRCGTGSVSLEATANNGEVRWYSSTSSSTVLGIGSPWTTPTISTTTTFYAAAVSAAPGQLTVGSGASNGTSAPYSPFGGAYGGQKTQYLFTASELHAAGLDAGNITALTFYVSAIGSTYNGFFIDMGTTLLSDFGATVNLQGGLSQVYSAASLTPALGANTYTLSTPFNWDGTSNIIVSLSWSNNTTTSTAVGYYYDATTNYASQSSKFDSKTSDYMHTLTGAITSGLYTTGMQRPKIMFDGINACSSPRVATLANVSTAEPLTLTSDQTVCNDAVATIEVTSNTGDYDSYIWSPATNLFIDPECHSPYDGISSVTTVYAKTATAGIYTYSCSSNNSFSSCSNLASSNVTVLPIPVITVGQSTICTSGSTAITTMPTNNYGTATFQWKNSTDNSTFNDISGANALTYTTPTINATTYYKLVLNLNGSTCTESNVATIVVNSPSVTTTTPATRCGIGTATLAATGSSGTVLNWYSVATGGTSLGIGNTFTTPSISATTSYYVGASIIGSNFNAAITTPSATTGDYWTNYGLAFSTLSDVVINSVVVYPVNTTPANMTIKLLNSAGNQVTGTSDVIFMPVSGTGSTPQTVNLNYYVPAGVNYKLVISSGMSTSNELVQETAGYTYPITTGPISITSNWNNGSTGTGYYDWFYNWNVTPICAGPRQEVVATVTPAASLTLTPNQTVCNNSINQLDVTSNTSDFDSYIWSPTTNLYNDFACTIPYDGSSKTTVYMKSATAGLYTYTCNAMNTTSLCANNTTTALTVLPAIPVISAVTPILCNTGTSVINSSPSTGYTGISLQWQNSTDDITFSDISGSTTLAFTTPTLTATTYYKLQLKNGTSVCAESNIVAVTVNPIPTVSVTPNTGSYCGSGSVALIASGATTYAWSPAIGLDASIGANVTASPSVTTTYTVTGTSDGCSANATATITVNAVPTTISVTPSSVSLCEGSIQVLSANGGTVAGNFTFGTGASTTSASTTSSTLGPNPMQNYYGGTKQQMIYTAAELQAAGISAGQITALKINLPVGDNTYSLLNYTVKMGLTAVNSFATTSSWITTGLVTVRNTASYTPQTGLNTLTFDTPFTWDGTSNIVLQMSYSNNNGGASTAKNTAKYSSTSFISTLFYRADNVVFNTIDAYVSSATASYSARTDVIFVASQNTSITWAPNSGLYTDASATTAYDGVSNFNTIYAKPGIGSHNYIATATSAVGCTSVSNTASVTVNPTFPVSVSIAASANPVNAGTSVTFTATPTNGGTIPAYQWYINGIVTGTNSNIFTYSPTDNDVITCQLTSDLVTCVTGNPAISSGITMTVNTIGAITRTWAGSTSENWTNPTNWLNGVPAAIDNVVVSATALHYPTITSTATIASLTLESGSSIIGEENLTITGTTTYKKDIDASKWHLISTPVSTGVTAANFQPTTGNGWLRNYTDGTGWGGYINVTTTPIAVGKGYALYLEQPKSVVLTGALNNGNYNLPLAYGTNGWNMLGNPYASGVDFALATKTNVSNNTMYLWDQAFAVANAGGYVSYNTNSSVGNAPGVTSVIPAFQGFFVEATAAGSVQFANSNRTHNAPAFYKSGSSTEIITRMKVNNAQGYTDYFVVCQNPSAGNGYESYDSKKFLAGTERPEMFAYATTGEKLTIDAIETVPQIIPMSVIVPQAGQLTFTAFEFDNSTVSIKLEDNQTGSFIDLRTQPSYSFSAIQGENNNRFFLHIGNTTGIEENNNNGFTSITANDKQIVVTPFGGEKINRIDVVDATGKLLSSVKANGNEKVTLSANFATGVYMVRVYGQGKVMTGKVTIW